MNDRVGQQFGNYRLIRLIGQGGFAEVYLGEHVHLKTLAAIKILYGKISTQDIELFTREARTIAALKHAHILRILDFGINQTLPYLVMEYASNGSLRDRHPAGSTLPLPTIVSYIKQIAPALTYTHANKLIHRDVKPENILIDQNETLLLSDFGIAAIAHSTSSMKTQDNLGTVHYMAPEHIKKKPRPASDQYALATMVYEWITGELPFFGDSIVEVAMSKLMEEPPPLREKVPTLPMQVEQVILKGLAQDLQERFPSIQSFAEALEQACITAQILPSPPITTVTSDKSHNRSITETALQVAQPSPAPIVEATSASMKSFPASSSISSSLPTFSRQTLLCTYRGHVCGASSLALSPDGRRLASNSTDRTICIWEVNTGKLLSTYEKKGDGIFSKAITWSPDGQHIASNKWSTVTIYNARTGEEVHSCTLTDIIGPGHALEDILAWSPDGNFIAALKDDEVLVLDAHTCKYIYNYKGHTGNVNAIAWSPNGKYLASASDDHTVQVWDVRSRKCVYTYEGHEGTMEAVAWSPDGKYLASGASGDTVQVWSADYNQTFLSSWLPKKELREVVNYEANNYLTALAWSPDSKCIAFINRNSVEIWETRTATNIHSYQESGDTKSVRDEIQAVIWSRDGKSIIIASRDKIQRWSSSTSSLLTTYTDGHLAGIYKIAWSPDGEYIASAANDDTVQVWHSKTGNLLRAYNLASSFWGPVLDWSPNSKLLAFTRSNRQNTVEIWNAQTEKHICTYTGHKDGLQKVAWSPDGRYIASGSSDHTVQVWEAQTGKRLCIYEGHANKVEALTWSPDGQYIATSFSFGPIQVQKAFTEKLLFSQDESYLESILWSSDSRYILATSGETMHIWERATGECIHTYRAEGGKLAVAWLSDGISIASATIKGIRVEQIPN